MQSLPNATKALPARVSDANALFVRKVLELREVGAWRKPAVREDAPFVADDTLF